jgi:hypothetical protein
MRVVCISVEPRLDSYTDGAMVEKGKIYTVLEVCKGRGRFEWWPFKTECYSLVGFDPDYVYPTKLFMEILEDEIDEMELVNEKTSTSL